MSNDDEPLVSILRKLNPHQCPCSYCQAPDEAADRIEILQVLVDLLRTALRRFVEAAQYEAMMEGPKFKGWNRSELDRALSLAQQALEMTGNGT